MKPLYHLYKSDIEIRITLGDLAKNNDTIDPQFRKCEYTITNETLNENEETETLWRVRGRLE